MGFPVSFTRFWTPCFIFRPDIFARACWRKLTRRPDRCVAKTAWDDWLDVEPHKFIGAQVYMRGVHELPVCEVLWRLAGTGETAIDVGANIGVMTSLLSRRVGEQGCVLAFEAHPGVFLQLQQNVRRWNRSQVEAFNLAISNRTGMVTVHEGEGFAANEGTARVHKAGVSGRCFDSAWGYSRRQQGSTFTPVQDPFSASGQVRALLRTGKSARRSGTESGCAWFEVESTKLDDMLPAAGCEVLKIDVEGHEFEVLLGANSALVARRIRDVVFESTWNFPGPAHELLLRHGYNLFGIDASLSGPTLTTVSPRSDSENRQADYLATVEPQRAKELIALAGWKVLRRRQ